MFVNKLIEFVELHDTCDQVERCNITVSVKHVVSLAEANYLRDPVVDLGGSEEGKGAIARGEYPPSQGIVCK